MHVCPANSMAYLKEGEVELEGLHVAVQIGPCGCARADVDICGAGPHASHASFVCPCPCLTWLLEHGHMHIVAARRMERTAHQCAGHVCRVVNAAQPKTNNLMFDAHRHNKVILKAASARSALEGPGSRVLCAQDDDLALPLQLAPGQKRPRRSHYLELLAPEHWPSGAARGKGLHPECLHLCCLLKMVKGSDYNKKF